MMRASVRRVLGRNGMLVLGLGIVLFMSLAALGAPWLAPYPPDAEHLDHVLEAPSVHFSRGCSMGAVFRSGSVLSPWASP